MKISVIILAVLGLLVASDAVLSKNELADQLGVSKETPSELIEDFLKNKDQISAWVRSLNDNHPHVRSGPRIPSLTCTACRAAIGLALNLIHQGIPPEEVAHSVSNLCMSLNLASEEICFGAVDHYIPALSYIMRNRDYLKTNDFCGILIQDGDCGKPNATFMDWDILVDQNKPRVETRPLLPADRPTVSVLQLTDIHLDLDYVEGSDANCGEPLCCRKPIPDNATVREPAGRFGSYACDFPQVAVDNLFEDAAARYNYSFVLLTGDYVHHEIWGTTQPGNMRHNTGVAKTLTRLFKTTNVYPVLGNHEPNPCNMYSPRSVWDVPGEDFNLSWLFNQIADLYSHYLPEEAIKSFQNYGYYTVSPSPGLRLVVLNTNLCYTLNFWLFYNTVDPEGQLQWFADTMLKAEQDGETVYIAGHVPPGHYQCWSPWADKFNRIINRFESIIQAQFYGHTHEDDLKVFFESPDSGEEGKEPRATNSLYIGASATTYTDLNAGYKVYHVDGAAEDRTWEILDHETWIYNLTLANAPGRQPEWFKLYSARAAYNLNSLRPEELYNLIERMVNDEPLFQTWYKHFNKGSDTYAPCLDSACRLKYLCDAVTTDIGDQSHCDRLKSRLGVDSP